jgi:hypothetical protein
MGCTTDSLASSPCQERRFFIYFFVLLYGESVAGYYTHNTHVTSPGLTVYHGTLGARYPLAMMSLFHVFAVRLHILYKDDEYRETSCFGRLFQDFILPPRMEQCDVGTVNDPRNLCRFPFSQ